MQTAQASQRELANAIRFLAIDAVNQAKLGHPNFWRKYVGLRGAVIGVARFGESAPAAQVYELLGVTTAKLIAAV